MPTAAQCETLLGAASCLVLQASKHTHGRPLSPLLDLAPAEAAVDRPIEPISHFI
jgi:hypothetical protein